MPVYPDLDGMFSPAAAAERKGGGCEARHADDAARGVAAQPSYPSPTWTAGAQRDRGGVVAIDQPAPALPSYPSSTRGADSNMNSLIPPAIEVDDPSTKPAAPTPETERLCAAVVYNGTPDCITVYAYASGVLGGLRPAVVKQVDPGSPTVISLRTRTSPFRLRLDGLYFDDPSQGTRRREAGDKPFVFSTDVSNGVIELGVSTDGGVRMLPGTVESLGMSKELTSVTLNWFEELQGPNEDYYHILRVHQTATQEEIRRAYYAQAMIKHPDKGGSDALFQGLKTAWAVLGDPVARAKYDAKLAAKKSWTTREFWQQLFRDGRWKVVAGGFLFIATGVVISTVSFGATAAMMAGSGAAAGFSIVLGSTAARIGMKSSSHALITSDDPADRAHFWKHLARQSATCAIMGGIAGALAGVSGAAILATRGIGFGGGVAAAAAGGAIYGTAGAISGGVFASDDYKALIKQGKYSAVAQDICIRALISGALGMAFGTLARAVALGIDTTTNGAGTSRALPASAARGATRQSIDMLPALRQLAKCGTSGCIAVARALTEAAVVNASKSADILALTAPKGLAAPAATDDCDDSEQDSDVENVVNALVEICATQKSRNKLQREKHNYFVMFDHRGTKALNPCTMHVDYNMTETSGTTQRQKSTAKAGCVLQLPSTAVDIRVQFRCGIWPASTWITAAHDNDNPLAYYFDDPVCAEFTIQGSRGAERVETAAVLLGAVGKKRHVVQEASSGKNLPPTWDSHAWSNSALA